jgi:hypothetical protein
MPGYTNTSVCVCQDTHMVLMSRPKSSSPPQPGGERDSELLLADLQDKLLLVGLEDGSWGRGTLPGAGKGVRPDRLRFDRSGGLGEVRCIHQETLARRLPSTPAPTAGGRSTSAPAMLIGAQVPPGREPRSTWAPTSGQRMSASFPLPEEPLAWSGEPILPASCLGSGDGRDHNLVWSLPSVIASLGEGFYVARLRRAAETAFFQGCQQGIHRP